MIAAEVPPVHASQAARRVQRRPRGTGPPAPIGMPAPRCHLPGRPRAAARGGPHRPDDVPFERVARFVSADPAENRPRFSELRR